MARRRHPHRQAGAVIPHRRKETLGDAWLTNERYRFGASSPNDLIRQIEKERSGATGPYYFSKPPRLLAHLISIPIPMATPAPPLRKRRLVRTAATAAPPRTHLRRPLGVRSRA
jgi:hypothetical protein